MIKVEELEGRIKKGDLSSIYLFYGQEKYILDNCVKNITRQFGLTVKGINYIILDEENIQTILSDIETPAFGFEKKLIIARNTKLFSKEAKKKNIELDKLRTKLNDYILNHLEQIKESIILIFIEEDVAKGKLLDTIEHNGIVCKFEEQTQIQLQKRLKMICNMYKVNIDNNTLQYFIECAGTNMQQLINEIRKLIEYTGENGTITIEVIDKLTIKQLDIIIFDLTDSLGKKDIKNALEVLKGLIYSKEPIQKILITLYNHFKKIYMVKLCMKYNKDIITTLKLKPNQTFLVNKYKQQARLFSEIELQEINKELIELDYKYKIGLIDINVGLESILCAYI